MRKIPRLLTADGINAKLFWEKVAPPSKNGCRLWTASKFPGGYGVFWVTLPDGRYVSARSNRVAYALHHGEAPYDRNVLHSCDVAGCCTKKHLRLGTLSDNSRDCVLRNRSNLIKRLDFAKARAVRDLYFNGGLTQTEIAISLGLSRQLIYQVVRDRIWREA